MMIQHTDCQFPEDLEPLVRPTGETEMGCGYLFEKTCCIGGSQATTQGTPGNPDMQPVACRFRSSIFLSRRSSPTLRCSIWTRKYECFLYPRISRRRYLSQIIDTLGRLIQDELCNSTVCYVKGNRVSHDCLPKAPKFDDTSPARSLISSP